MNVVLAPKRLPVAWPEPYDGLAVGEANYWAGYYLDQACSPDGA